MKSQGQIIRAFSEGATRGTASHLFIEGDKLFSYGHHFILAVRYRREGDYRFLLNGDKYSASTSGHQRACFRLGPQVPFSALRAAGLRPEYVRIEDQREDGWHEIPDPTPEEPDRVKQEHTLGAVLLESDGKYFLSSLDENEHWRRRSYFLCQLPREVRNVADAYDSLLPDKVREWRGRKDNPPDKRQGEWFFLPTEYETRHLPQPTLRHAPLLDTTHYVTELRKNGDLFCRGAVRHKPERRRSQHVALKLAKVWHEAVKNTAVGSWNAGGMVD